MNLESPIKEDADIILADIEIARANLYVFDDSKERDKWIDLLEKAQKNLSERPEYSRKLIIRVTDVTNKLWERIFKWRDFQKKVIICFICIILGEMIAIGLYYYFIDVLAYGFYSAMLFGLLGGTLGVILNLAKDLQIEETNQLGIFKLILRPLIGSVSAVLIFIFLQLKIIVISPFLDPKFVLIVLSIAAGYSERFISKALNDYVPKIFKE